MLRHRTDPIFSREQWMNEIQIISVDILILWLALGRRRFMSASENKFPRREDDALALVGVFLRFSDEALAILCE